MGTTDDAPFCLRYLMPGGGVPVKRIFLEHMQIHDLTALSRRARILFVL